MKAIAPLDRSSWSAGPWDGEPDYYEWHTSIGYDTFCHRLGTGAWVGVIVAPFPSGTSYEKHKFYSALHNIHRDYEHHIAMVFPADKEGYGEYSISMEHWFSPGSSKHTFIRGPYKTLLEVKQIVEKIAEDIFKQIGKL